MLRGAPSYCLFCVFPRRVAWRRARRCWIALRILMMRVCRSRGRWLVLLRLQELHRITRLFVFGFRRGYFSPAVKVVCPPLLWGQWWSAWRVLVLRHRKKRKRGCSHRLPASCFATVMCCWVKTRRGSRLRCGRFRQRILRAIWNAHRVMPIVTPMATAWAMVVGLIPCRSGWVIDAPLKMLPMWVAIGDSLWDGVMRGTGAVVGIASVVASGAGLATPPPAARSVVAVCRFRALMGCGYMRLLRRCGCGLPAATFV